MNLLFVYGTLKKGFQRSQLLTNQRYLGTASTKPAYKMYQMGSFPALVPAEDGHEIHGELYEVEDECLVQLDKVEGVHKGLFERRYIELESLILHTLPITQLVFDDYHKKRAVCYFYNRPIDGSPRDCGSFWCYR